MAIREWNIWRTGQATAGQVRC